MIKEQIRQLLSDEDDNSACSDLPEKACTYLPKNFTFNVLNGACTKLAEKIISPDLTLPWILSGIGAPAYIVGMLVPVKNVFSLLPQLFISGKIRQYKVRKYFWVTAGAIQAAMMLMMGLVVYQMDNAPAGWLILILFALFNLFSGVGSVSFKDVLAKTLPKGKRGRLLGMRATSGGVLALIAGLVLRFYIKGEDSNLIFAGMFGVSFLLWLLASILFSGIAEPKGEKDESRGVIKEIKKGAGILKKDKNFKNFIVARGLLMTIPLAFPFYTLLAKELTGKAIGSLGILIITMAAANIISSPVWGKFSDKSSKKIMMVVSAIAIFTAALAFSVQFLPQFFLSIYIFVPIFLLNALAYAGARLSRKTYLVDYAPEEERPLYVSVSNTLIGIIALFSSVLGLIAHYFSLNILLVTLVLLLLAGMYYIRKLKAV